MQVTNDCGQLRLLFWRTSHPSLRIARQCQLQSQCRARQTAHRRAPAVDRSINRTRRPQRGHRCCCRSSAAMSLLRRPHNHCRELRTRRHTPRPAITPSQQRLCDVMMPVTTSPHIPPAGRPRFRRSTTVAPPSPKPHLASPVRPKSPTRPPPQRQNRYCDLRS